MHAPLSPGRQEGRLLSFHELESDCVPSVVSAGFNGTLLWSALLSTA